MGHECTDDVYRYINTQNALKKRCNFENGSSNYSCQVVVHRSYFALPVHTDVLCVLGFLF